MAAFEYFGGRCQVCGSSTKQLHLHHKPWGYQHLYREDLHNDVILLCFECHAVAHEDFHANPKCERCHQYADTCFNGEVLCWGCVESYEMPDGWWIDPTLRNPAREQNKNCFPDPPPALPVPRGATLVDCQRDSEYVF